MSHVALCPSCQKEVVFQMAEGVSLCPACGARFEVATTTGRRRVRVVHGLIFVPWMLAPSVLALVCLTALPKSFGNYLVNHAQVIWAFAALSLISCYACCSWFMSRFTRKLWARMLVGFFLGLGIFLCNAVVVGLAGCFYIMSNK